MKKKTTEAKTFNETPIKKWIITDSDGTVAPFVPLEQKEKARPSEEFLANIRQASLDDPQLGIMILTGRESGEANMFYGATFQKDDEGRRPKIVLATENGAFMQFKAIDSKKERLTGHQDIVSIANPLTKGETDEFDELMRVVAGEHYTNNDRETAKNKWVKTGTKTCGFSVHFKPPISSAELKKYEAIKSQLAVSLQDFGKKNKLLVHLGAAESFLIDRISKGMIMEKVASNDEELAETFLNNGLLTEVPQKMSYSGDDVGDWDALKVLNEKLTNGELQGYTSRPCNYTPLDPDTRTPNGFREAVVQDSFFILGSRKVLPQEQHMRIFTNPDSFEQLSNVRKALEDRQLLPSQSKNSEAPSIILLTSGDILIYEPERYSEEALNGLRTWDQGKVILLANSNTALIELPESNENLVVVTSDGKLYSKKQSTDTLAVRDIQAQLQKSNELNLITSISQERSKELQTLRSIQEVLVENVIIENILQGQSINASTTSSETFITEQDTQGLTKLKVTSEKSGSYDLSRFTAVVPLSASQKKNRRKKERKKERKKVDKELKVLLH